MRPLRAAEFFAGIGLVRSALEDTGWRVVFANDIEPFKQRLYSANFAAADFVPGDVRDIQGRAVPDIDLATASFPCTDLSLAGDRRGLAGEQSGMFWEFARIIDEMGTRRPVALLLENVPSFATSKGGADLAAAITRLNDLGYHCHITIGDARHFVPQSRQRLFLVGTSSSKPLRRRDLASPACSEPVPRSQLDSLRRFVAEHPELRASLFDLDAPQPTDRTLADIVERLPEIDSRWWEDERVAKFVDSLSLGQAARLERMRNGRGMSFATACRRTRRGHATWEIRADRISGCLRTARGGSSRQALVQAGRGDANIRWMTAREYARLQGVPDFLIPPTVSENQALSGFGDAVAVPVVAWLSEHYLTPLVRAAL